MKRMNEEVRHWNATRVNAPMTGVKRYEDEIFSALRNTSSEEWSFERVARHPNLLLGSTFLSWLFTYRTGGANLVHATEETILPAACIHRPKQTVVTCHGLIPLRYPSTISDLTTRLQWSLVPRALRYADRIIAISEFTKSEILDLTDVSASKIDVVYHGIDHERYQPMDQRESRRDLDIEFDSQKKYVLVVASNLEQKRMDLVRDAFDEIRSQSEDIVLLKAGYAETLEEAWVKNTGWIDEVDMPKLYNAVDVFFHPSEYESFGFPVLESMACGTPVVASNRASVPEVAGDAAELLDPDAEDAGVQYADAIVENLDSRVDEKAVRQSRNFTWEDSARDVLRIYEDMLES